MDFADYAQQAADLVNADICDLAALRRFLGDREWLSDHARAADIVPLQKLQSELRTLVDASAAGDDAGVVSTLNGLLASHPVRPRISGHDASSWHLHVTDRGAEVAEIVAAEALFGLALLVTERGADRFGRCRAAGCGRAFLDLTTNRTRQYCSTRCATRTNVAAYRSRRRAVSSMAPAGARTEG